MKRLLLYVLLFVAVDSRAQNWNPLGPVGVKRYFVNDDGYVRGMRVDSVRVVGSDSVWYPFRSLRGPVPSTTLDSNGSSWLGKAVRKRPDGTWLFNTWRSDTVVIKPLAAVGDSWRFYDDTAALWYQATVTSVDTQTTLGELDSIKTITLAAMSGTTPLLTDSLNGWTIVLSRTHGFAYVPDLHMWPYPRLGNLQPTPDLFLALATANNPGSWGNFTGIRRARFRVIQYQHPTHAHLYHALQTGDAAYYSFIASSGQLYAVEGYFVDTVATRTQGSTADLLFLKRWRWNRSPYPLNLTQSNLTIIVDSVSAINTALLLPEEYPNTHTIYFNPTDTTYSTVSAAWDVWNSFFGGTSAYPYLIYPRQDIFKARVGHVYYRKPSGDNPGQEHRLLAYRIGGTTYGTPFGAPNSILDLSASTSTVSAVPIPASSSLRIHHPVAKLTFYFTDVTGRIIQAASSNPSATTTDIDVSRWPTGLYSMTATAPDGARHSQKIIIAR